MNESPDVDERTIFDAHAVSYEEEHRASILASGEDPAYFHEHKMECLARLGLSVDGPLLDFGCGIGNLTERLVTRHSEVHGYDPSSRSVARARERAPTAQFHTDATKLPKEHFATAVLSGVLHHVPKGERRDVLMTVRA